MDKIKLSIFAVTLFSICIGIILLFHTSGTPVTDSSMSTTKLLGLHWIGVFKFVSAFIAGGILLYQGFFGTILRTVKTSVILIGIGIWAIAFGYGYEFYVRVFIEHHELASSLFYASILYLIGGILVAWALFAFPKKLDITLKDSQKMWFYLSLWLVLILTVAMFFIPNYINPDPIAFATQIIYPTLTLVVFAAALRCTMVFSGGKIGRPFYSFLLVV